MALRDVNLVPPDFAAHRLLVRHVALWSSCLALSLAVAFAVYLAEGVTVRAERQALFRMKDTERRLSAGMEEQKRLRIELAALGSQRSQLDAVRAERQSLARVIERLSEIMNGGTWLSRLSVETTEGKQRETLVMLAGYALSNEDLGDFLSRLSGDAMFRGVTLRFSGGTESGQAKKGGQGRIRFQIGCRLSRG